MNLIIQKLFLGFVRAELQFTIVCETNRERKTFVALQIIGRRPLGGGALGEYPLDPVVNEKIYNMPYWVTWKSVLMFLGKWDNISFKRNCLFRQTQKYMFSKCLLRHDVLRVFVSSLVLVFLRAILSWCP